MAKIHSVHRSMSCPHCKTRGEYVFCRDRNFVEACDTCGHEIAYDGDTERRGTVAGYVNTQFYGSGQVSMAHGFAKSEVSKARQMYPDHQHCIKDSGRVHFANRSEERSFVKRKKSLGL